MLTDKPKSIIIVGQTQRFLNFFLDTIIYFIIILGLLMIFNGVTLHNLEQTLVGILVIVSLKVRLLLCIKKQMIITVKISTNV